MLVEEQSMNPFGRAAANPTEVVAEEATTKRPAASDIKDLASLSSKGICAARRSQPRQMGNGELGQRSPRCFLERDQR